MHAWMHGMGMMMSWQVPGWTWTCCTVMFALGGTAPFRASTEGESDVEGGISGEKDGCGDCDAKRGVGDSGVGDSGVGDIGLNLLLCDPTVPVLVAVSFAVASES
jgi:hypothetical protein